MFARRHAVHRVPSPLPAIGRAFPNRRAEVVAGVRALRAVSSPYRAMAHFRSTTQGVRMFVPLNVLKVLSSIETPQLRGVPDATGRPLVDSKADRRDTLSLRRMALRTPRPIRARIRARSCGLRRIDSGSTRRDESPCFFPEIGLKNRLWCRTTPRATVRHCFAACIDKALIGRLDVVA